MQTYDPFDELKRIQDRVDSIFGGQSPATGANMDMPGMDIRQHDIIVTVDMPPVDIRQQGSEIIVTVDMPGVDENDIDIDVMDDQVLEISAQEKNRKTGEEEAGFMRTERQYMYYCRSIMLPAPVDKSKTRSSYDNGVLEISMPVAHKTTAGEIAVS
jgi:HSP20 family protein